MDSRKKRGKAPGLTQVERRQIMRELKDKALAGNLDAICALSNFELAEITRKKMYAELDSFQ